MSVIGICGFNSPTCEGEAETFACEFFDDLKIEKNTNLELMTKLQNTDIVVFLGDLMFEFTPNIVAICGFSFGSYTKEVGFSMIDHTKQIQMDRDETYINDINHTYVLVDACNVVQNSMKFFMKYIVYDNGFREMNADFNIEDLSTGKYSFEIPGLRITFKAVEVDFDAAKEFLECQ